MALQPTFIRCLLEALRTLLCENVEVATPVDLCSVKTRVHLRRLLQPILPKVVVVSPHKIPRSRRCAPLEFSTPDRDHLRGLL